MEALFLQILNMSMSASWLIVAVIVIRFLLKNAPKGFRYVLWALVAVRLLCPTVIESDFSLVPSQNVIESVGEVIKPTGPDISEEGNGSSNDTTQENQENEDLHKHSSCG